MIKFPECKGERRITWQDSEQSVCFWKFRRQVFQVLLAAVECCHRPWNLSSLSFETISLASPRRMPWNAGTKLVASRVNSLKIKVLVKEQSYSIIHTEILFVKMSIKNEGIFSSLIYLAVFLTGHICHVFSTIVWEFTRSNLAEQIWKVLFQSVRCLSSHIIFKKSSNLSGLTQPWD